MVRQSDRYIGWLELAFLCCLGLPAVAGADGELQMADLGDFALESGDVLEDCRLEYRTFGELNADGSNAILFPTWFTGTTQDFMDRGFVGSGRLLDTSKHFVVAVGAFANGVSCSPSTSSSQPGRAFPRFSIRDLVLSQHFLVHKVLGIERLYGAVGFSMGGLQVLEWMVAYPDFVERAVSIVSTPRPTPYDRLAIGTEIGLIEQLACSDDPDTAMPHVSNVHALLLWTPEFFVSSSAEQVEATLEEVRGLLARSDPIDFVRQLQAVLTQDIGHRFGGSLEAAASAIRARLLMVVSSRDHLVSPRPGLDLAQRLDAETLVLAGDCGHMSAFCEIDAVTRAVQSFLDSGSPGSPGAEPVDQKRATTSMP